MINRSLFSSLCQIVVPVWARQHVRTTAIFRRMYPPHLYSVGRTGPFRPKLKRREYVYIMEENTNMKPAGNMEVILATNVDGLGFKGDIVTVKKRLARTHMLPVGVAEYVSPDNLAKYECIRKENEGRPRQSLSGHKTLKELEGLMLPVPMSSTVAWVLNKTHLRVAFRACGIELSEDCITLPEPPIDKPGEYMVGVTINKLNSMKVKTIIYHYNKSLAPSLPPVWTDSESNKFKIEEVIATAAKLMRTRST